MLVPSLAVTAILLWLWLAPTPSVSAPQAGTAPSQPAKPSNLKADTAPPKSDKSPKNLPAPTKIVATRSTRNTAVKTTQLVPPPPPSVPGMSITPQMMPGWEQIEYAGRAELSELQERTIADLTRATKKLSQNKELAADKKHRAHSFETLYTEGVVSRRELENARHDASTIEDDLDEQTQRVADLGEKLKRLQIRLKSLPAEKKKTETAKKSLNVIK